MASQEVFTFWGESENYLNLQDTDTNPHCFPFFFGHGDPASLVMYPLHTTCGLCVVLQQLHFTDNIHKISLQCLMVQQNAEYRYRI
jgi:hypothetical protein